MSTVTTANATTDAPQPYQTLLIHKIGSVDWVTFNRPDQLNALTYEMVAEITDYFQKVTVDTSVRIIVLRGAGRAFCSGQDLASIAERYTSDAPIELGTHLRKTYNRIVLKMRTMEKPIIASVNGVAAGAGCSLALACDMRVAGESASFIQAFINVGLVPDSGGSFMLPRLIGLSRAMEMACTGRKVKADEALRIGLVNQVVADDQLLEATTKLATRLASLPPRGIGLTKRILNASLENDLATQLDYEAMMQTTAGRTKDHREGVTAFLEKRPPKFVGE